MKKNESIASIKAAFRNGLALRGTLDKRRYLALKYREPADAANYIVFALEQEAMGDADPVLRKIPVHERYGQAYVAGVWTLADDSVLDDRPLALNLEYVNDPFLLLELVAAASTEGFGDDEVDEVQVADSNLFTRVLRKMEAIMKPLLPGKEESAEKAS